MTRLSPSALFASTLLLGLLLSTANMASANPEAEDHHKLGKNFLVNQNFELALKEFNASLKIDPNSAATLVDRGTAYNGLRKYEQAMADFNSAIKLDPKNYLAYNNRGVTRFRRDELSQAILDFDKAIELSSDQPIAYLNRAGASLAQGNGIDSSKKIERWLRKTDWKGEYAGHASVLAALGYRQGGNPATADRIMEEALKKTDRLKWPYPALKFLTGKLSGKELLEEAESSDYDSTQAHCFLALKYLTGKDKKLAQTHLDWVVKTGTQNSVEYWIAKSLTNPRAKKTLETGNQTPQPVIKQNASKSPTTKAAPGNSK
jgi:Tfp pilus assembly protein PilF